MSVNPIANNQSTPGNINFNNQAQKPEKAGNTEVTTVTTHCDKQHMHDRSCPHTVTTAPAPKNGQYGSELDTLL